MPKNNQNIELVGIIPARYGSSRFPGKPLTMIKDKTMIEWVYRACKDVFTNLFVATDDSRIEQAVYDFGGKVIFTRDDHASGTDRLGEALEIIENVLGIYPKIIVNIQGDEPLIQPAQIEELLSCFEDENCEIATLIQPFEKDENHADPNIVKVVTDKQMKALYFSRLAIPFSKETTVERYKHIGLYAYRADILKKLCTLSPTQLELSESLEQLRWIENGYSLQTKITKYKNIGVDTPSDIEKIIQLLK